VYEVTEKLPEYGLKKGDQLCLDGLHKDHLEIFDKKNLFRDIFNLDGSPNTGKARKAANEGRKLKWRTAMLFELNSTLKALDKINEKSRKDLLLKEEIKDEEKEIDDFHQLQDYIQQYLAITKAKKLDETIMTQSPLLRIYSQLGSCINNVELVRDLVKKLISHLSPKDKATKDG